MQAITRIAVAIVRIPTGYSSMARPWKRSAGFLLSLQAKHPLSSHELLPQTHTHTLQCTVWRRTLSCVPGQLAIPPTATLCFLFKLPKRYTFIYREARRMKREKEKGRWKARREEGNRKREGGKCSKETRIDQ